MKDKEKKDTLVTVPSGTIDIVDNGTYQTLEYNCSCMDALPYCHAMCCRMRPHYNVRVTEEESDSGKWWVVSQEDQKEVLASKEGNCYYLGENSLCTIHDDKPSMCTAWHCSPEGVGEGIKVRSKGWFVSPTTEIDGNPELLDIVEEGNHETDS